jgi:DNA-binding transcriptional LysR family regulator
MSSIVEKEGGLADTPGIDDVVMQSRDTGLGGVRETLLNSISIRKLEYYVAAAKYKSLSHAASALGVNQSALSRQILALERDLRVRLFHRHGRGVVLTDFGERLLTRAQRVIEEIRSVAEDAIEAESSVPHRAVISLPTSVGSFLVGPISRLLGEAYPGIVVRFVELISPELQQSLSAGSVDIAVFYRDRTTRQLNTETLVTEPLYLVASSQALGLDVTTPASRLDQFPLIHVGRAQNALFDTTFTGKRMTLNVIAESESILLATKLAEENCGYVVLPFSAVRNQVLEGQLQASRIVEPQIETSLVLATTSRPAIRRISQIVKLIRKECRAQVGALGAEAR